MLAAYIAALLLVPPLCAWVLRRMSAPGAAALGGVIAGVLLGPTILGRLAPQAFERVVLGGLEQRENLRTLDRQRGAYELAEQAVGTDSAARAEQLQHFATQRSEAEAQWRSAQADHQRPLRVLALIVAALTMLAAAGDSDRGNNLSAAGRPSWLGAMTIGAWSAAAPGGLAYLAARWWGESTTVAAMIAAAVAIGPWVLNPIDRQAADEAEIGGAQLMRTAGRFASSAAIGVAVVVLWLRGGWAGLSGAIPLAALVIAWALAEVFARRGAAPVQREAASGSRALVVRLANAWLVPVLAACAAARIELFRHLALWPLVILPLLSGDGRWMGALIGALLPGGRGGVRVFRTMRLVLGSMAAGPTQLAMVVVGLTAGAIGESAAYGLIIGALVIEVTVPARRIMASRLVETEEELERRGGT